MNNKQKQWEDNLPMSSVFDGVKWQDDNLKDETEKKETTKGDTGADLGGLVLTRKPGETIAIDGKIRVTILYSDKYQVKLCIKAPDHISIHRKEIEDKINNALQDKVKQQQELINGKT